MHPCCRRERPKSSPALGLVVELTYGNVVGLCVVAGLGVGVVDTLVLQS